MHVKVICYGILQHDKKFKSRQCWGSEKNAHLLTVLGSNPSYVSYQTCNTGQNM